jgi:hypothetical protein
MITELAFCSWKPFCLKAVGEAPKEILKVIGFVKKRGYFDYFRNRQTDLKLRHRYLISQ